MRRSSTLGLAMSLVASVGAVAWATQLTGRISSAWHFAGPRDVATWSLLMVAAAATGAFIGWRAPGNQLGPLLAVGGATGAIAALGDQAAAQWIEVTPRPALGAVGTVLSIGGLYLSWAILGVAVLLRFPAGNLRTRTGRALTRIAFASAAGCTAIVFSPELYTGDFVDVGASNPLGISGAAAVVDVLFVGIVGLFGALFAAVGSLVVSYRRSSGIERQQLRVVAAAAATSTIVLLVAANLHGVVGGTAVAAAALEVVTTAAMALVPMSIAVAVLRFRLFEVDLAIVRGITYGAMAAFVGVAYVGGVGTVGAVVGRSTGGDVAASIVITGVIAVAFQSVRERVERAANRFVHGEKADPYDVLAAFSRRMSEALSLDDVLPRTAEAAAQGLGVAAVRVSLDTGTGRAASAVHPPAAAHTAWGRLTPIVHRGVRVGSIELAASDTDLDPAAERLLEDLAAQAAIAFRNAQLAGELEARVEEVTAQAAELRESRRRIVTAQDAERKRVERDLHDGAQQRLVSLGLLLRMAGQRQRSGDVDATASLLEESLAELGRAHAELRELARGIYPAVLVDGGLGPALAALADRSPVPVRHEVDVPRLPAPVEAAAYFIVNEALTNAVNHAGADEIVISARVQNDRLVVRIADDGVGGARTAGGTGLTGLVDRAAAVGGVVRIASPRAAGTEIRAELPCA